MFAVIKRRLEKTKLFKTFLWLKYTRKIGLRKRLSNPSSTRTKQLFIKKLGRKNSIDTLIETGTYLGDMVYANINNFKKIYSVELDEKLYRRARARFKKYKHIRIVHGDSAAVLSVLVNKIHSKSLFWLDAHYSGGITAKGENNTPVERELNIILRRWKKGSAIIIDDARLFTGQNEYPKIETLRKLFADNRLKTEIYKDMIAVK
jgi:predicted O-methyltransferase YrrM